MSAVTRGPWADAAVPITRNANGITPRELEPLWPGVLWHGKPTLIVGDPGLGKSLVTVDIAARESRGTPWPLDATTRPAGRVLMLSAEDAFSAETHSLRITMPASRRWCRASACAGVTHRLDSAFTPRSRYSSS